MSHSEHFEWLEGYSDAWFCCCPPTKSVCSISEMLVYILNTFVYKDIQRSLCRYNYGDFAYSYSILISPSHCMVTCIVLSMWFIMSNKRIWYCVPK